MRELSLFTGAGGGILGSELLGWTTVGYVEWEPYCQRVIKQRIEDGIFDNAPIFGDIRAFNSEGYSESYKGLVDIVTGGFPCQPFSVAGKQLGADDPRNMWPETIRTLRTIRPKFAFFENVAALLSSGYFETILCDLHEMGYNVRWCVLSASDVGAPHKRDRLWILCSNTDCKSRSSEQKSKYERAKKSDGCSLWGVDAPIANTTIINDREYSSKQVSGQIQQSGECDIKTDASDTTIKRLEGEIAASGTGEYDGLSSECGWWTTEPGICRVVNGLANRSHRLKAIGNGQVPITMAAAFQALSQGII